MGTQLTQKTPNQIQEDLKRFNGSEEFYRINKFMPQIIITEGIKFMADLCQCYWFLDIICSCQLIKRVRAEEFQVWKILKATVDSTSCLVTCDDGNNNVIYSQIIEFTDFPMKDVKIYFTNNTILLPSEN